MAMLTEAGRKQFNEKMDEYYSNGEEKENFLFWDGVSV